MHPVPDADYAFDMGHDDLRRALTCGFLLPLLGHSAWYQRYGQAGRVTLLVLYVAFSLATVVFSIRQFILRSKHGAVVPVLKWTLLCVCVFAAWFSWLFESAGFYDLGLGCLAGLLILAIKDWFGARGANPPRQGSSTTYT